MLGKHRKRNSYFYKFLVNMILTLFVPGVTILLLWGQAERTVREQILIASESTLNQFFRLVDDSARTMSRTSVSIADHQDCETYAGCAVYQPERIYYQSYVLKNTLANFFDGKYEDVFVYFPEVDRVVSGSHGSLNSENYYRTYYADKTESNREDFYSLITCENKIPGFRVMDSGGEMPYLCVTMRRLNPYKSGNDYVVVLVLDQEYVNLLMNVEDGDSSRVMIFDKNRELLLTSASDADVCHMEDYTGSSAPFSTHFGTEAYMMQVRESDVMNVYYASAVPRTYFWRRLLQLRIICGIGVLTCVMISVLVGYRLIRRSYRPIDNMMSSLQSRSDLLYDEKMGNEFDYIAALFDHEKEERLSLSQEIRSDHLMRRERFLFSLLEGAGTQAGFGDDIFVSHGIELCSDRFCAAILEVEEKGALEDSLLQFIVKNVFRELGNRQQKGYFLPLTGERFCVLLNGREGFGEEDFRELLEEGKEFLEEHYQILLTVGAGSVQEGAAGIKVSCDEAKRALEYRYLYGPGSLISAGQVRGREFRYLDSGESRLSSMVTGYIKGKTDGQSAEGFVAELLKQYGIDENASLETVEYFRLEAVNAMNKAIMTNGCLAESRRTMTKELLSQPTLEAFQEYFADILNRLYQKEKENATREDVSRKAYLYIEEHFPDSQLSVSLLGEALGISPSYLSKLFKEKYGLSIPDCIARERIRSAKEQLRDTKRSIQEIAEACGFLSSNVLIKTFKKWEGITPGVYRNLL